MRHPPGPVGLIRAAAARRRGGYPESLADDDVDEVDELDEPPSDGLVVAPPSPLEVPDPLPDGLPLEPGDALEVLDRESVE